MRHFWFSYTITICLLSLLASILIWVFEPFSSVKNIDIYSPLPKFLSLVSNNQVATLNIFVPAKNILGSSVIPPVIHADVALIYDITTQKALFEKSATIRHPMASLTKIMTAIVALENKKEKDAYLVRKESLVGEDSMGVSVGEILMHEELLYGLMLPSGNDAAEVFADNYKDGRNAFITAMNNKAKTLGLKDTNFTNPSGLQGDGNQYTTAYDLLVMTQYALEQFPLFRTVVATPYHDIPYTKQHKYFPLYNETNLLTTYKGVKGVKTGYTPEAGLCLVTYLDYGGHKIIGVLLGSNNRRQEMRDLLDYSLQTLGIKPTKHN